MSTRKIQEGAGGTPKDSRTEFKKISEQYTCSSCNQVKSGSTKLKKFKLRFQWLKNEENSISQSKDMTEQS